MAHRLIFPQAGLMVKNRSMDALLNSGEAEVDKSYLSSFLSWHGLVIL